MSGAPRGRGGGCRTCRGTALPAAFFVRRFFVGLSATLCASTAADVFFFRVDLSESGARTREREATVGLSESVCSRAIVCS